ncbi:MAG: hypothetical protein K2Q18_01225 [Bdellovibrionales bacterium]|nr:hypothetical protein [Bdellovibrionales bacterium]
MKALSALGLIFFFTHVSADDRASIMLRGIVPPSVRTKVVQTELSSSLSLVTFSSQINSRYVRETQKFEVEGLDQDGMESHIKLVAGNDRTIQYELLINRLKSVAREERPIFLKISAN